jgi:hypothetical protein
VLNLVVHIAVSLGKIFQKFMYIVCDLFVLIATRRQTKKGRF